ncbi:class I SAM-dependent methyltransferase family protein, partial [Candidatus Woesearchaeota archaeon]|nr:class I SAM-dependent methyltransferase family protein [Candidatus Woesearchaeota archaeon]
NLKYYLKNKLTNKELKLVPSSFDVVGDILIFSEFPKELAKKEKIIGNTLLENYNRIKTILKKTKKYSGKFRTPKLKVIAGEKRKESICKENNVFIKLDVEKVYFSPRMASERKRIAELIKPNESILVMFSGCAPFPLVIAKNTKCKEIYGVEINRIAHKYALENVKKNKLENKIRLFLGDVKRIMPKLNKKFDRILMPLPKGGENFLNLALKYAKAKGIVHFYDFEHENEFYKTEEKAKKACNRIKRKCEILNIVRCGQYSPGFYRVCVDFEVN